MVTVSELVRKFLELIARHPNNGEIIGDHVSRAISEQQDRSEQLIGWFQLAIVVTFAILFTLTPKQLSIPIWYRAPVWVLTMYVLFTVARLVLSYRRRLPAWLLVLSVVADIALLMALIWGFHIEYGQPPSFSLKAPTLLYVFIFIALRALRFDAFYVFLAGVTAAAGWALMIMYAVVYDLGSGTGAAVTRNYVTYLTSNSILLGAEFDKIISILIVTIVLSVAIIRARSLLIKSSTEQLAAGALARFFSPAVASQIREAREEIHAGDGQLRDCAILIIDIRGFTALAASMTPTEAIALLVEYQKRLVPIIQRQGGAVDKFLGDGILASFGCVEKSETYAADALRAVRELRIASELWARVQESSGKNAVAIGMAVATGRVIFGAIGDPSRLEFTVIGDPVNLATKHEKHTKAEGVHALATVETYELAIKQGYMPGDRVEYRRAREVEGVTGHVDLAVLV
ncbi:MAG: adenylate/guanylate cyclase domain-containing protein [Nitrospiraceae bacterium]